MSDVEQVTLGEVYRIVKGMSEKLDALPGTYVQVAVWSQRNEVVDRAFKSLEDRCRALEDNTERRRTPWPTVVTAIAAIAAIGLSVVLALVRLQG